MPEGWRGGTRLLDRFRRSQNPSERDMEIEEESRDEKDIDVCSEDGPEDPGEEINVQFEDQHKDKGEGTTTTGPEGKRDEESKSMTTGLEKERNEEQKGTTTGLKEERNEERKGSEEKRNEERKGTTTGLKEERNEERKGSEEKPKEESKDTIASSEDKQNEKSKGTEARPEESKNGTTLLEKFKDAMKGHKSDVDIKTLKTWREVPPSHYIVKIKSFSSLVKSLEKNEPKNYKSDEFEASGCKWHLLLYPSVEKEKGPHVCLSLEFVSPKKFDKEIKAVVIFFLHDQLKNRYLSIQDIDVKRFNGKIKESELSPIVPLGDFKDPLNGYLVKDECAFGVEVFVLEDGGKTKASFRSRMKESKKVYTWNVKKLFLLGKTRSVYSKPFTFGSNLEEVYKWRLHLYKVIDEENNRYMSISICLLQMENQTQFPLGWKMHLEFKFSLTNHDVEKKSRTGKAWFSEDDKAWGFPKFIKWDDLRGYDDVKIEVEFIQMSMEIIDQKPKPKPKEEEDSSPSNKPK